MITNNNTALLAQTESNIALGALSNALSVSNALTPANTIEQNYTDFYKAYLNYKQDTITVSDSITLSNLANGCVQRYGFVVLQARALYSLIYKDFTVHNDDCGNNNAKVGTFTDNVSKSQNERFFNLYPNPNCGTMTLEYTLKGDESGIMLINDISGRKLAEFTLNAKNNTIVINETHLKNGIYYYNIIVNNELIKTDRIVIIK